MNNVGGQQPAQRYGIQGAGFETLVNQVDQVLCCNRFGGPFEQLVDRGAPSFLGGMGGLDFSEGRVCFFQQAVLGFLAFIDLVLIDGQVSGMMDFR